MNQAVLYGFCARRELTDGQVQITVDDAPFRGPVIPCKRPLVEKIAYTGRETEHGK
jgi:hypothetical protein